MGAYKKTMLCALVLLLAVFADWSLVSFDKKDKKFHHIILGEDVSAAKAGDTLAIDHRGDTTFVLWKEDCPNCQLLIVLGN